MSDPTSFAIFLAFVERHPWACFFTLCVLCATLVACCEVIASRGKS